MTLAYENAQTESATSTDTVTIAGYSADYGNDGTRQLFVVTSYRKDEASFDEPDVEFDGVPLTLVSFSGTSGGDEVYVAIFRLADPSRDDGDIVVEYANTKDVIAVAAFTLTGIGEAAASATGSASSSAVTSLTVSTTASAYSAAVYVFAHSTDAAGSLTGADEVAEVGETGLRLLVGVEQQDSDGGAIGCSSNFAASGNQARTHAIFAAPGPNQVIRPGRILPQVRAYSPQVLLGGTLASSFAKRDTVFLGESETGDWEELADDASQEATDITDAATWAYESTSRIKPVAPFCVELKVGLSTASDGALVVLTNGSTQGVALHLDVGDQVFRLTVGADGNGELELPYVAESGEQNFAIYLGAESNRDATGTADATRYWVAWWHLGTGDHDSAYLDWSTPDEGESYALILGAQSTGGSVTLTDCPVYKARVSDSCHGNGYEAFHDFAGVRQDGRDALERQSIELPVGVDGFDTESSFAGPHYSLAAASARSVDRRTVGTAVNRAGYFGPRSDDAGARLLSPDKLLYFHRALVFYAALPANVNQCVFRANIVVHTGATAAQLRARAWCLNYFPYQEPGGRFGSPTSGAGSGGGTQPVGGARDYRHSVIEGRSSQEGTYWITFDPLALVRDADGACWFALALHNPGSARVWEVRSLSIDLLSGQFTTSGTPPLGVSS